MEQQTVERALAVLNALKDDVQGLSELSRRLNLSKATLLRLLNTLRSHGYVDYNEKTQKYDLGLELLQLGMTVSLRFDLKKAAAPYMEKVWQACGETVYLNVRNGFERLCIEALQGIKDVRVVAYSGHKSPLYVGASGKAILAFLPEEELKEFLATVQLQKVAPGTIVDEKILIEDLIKTRALGYATSFEERFSDALGASAPIRDASGQVIASISITAPSNRSAKEVAQYIALVKEAGQAISQRLGYLG